MSQHMNSLSKEVERLTAALKLAEEAKAGHMTELQNKETRVNVSTRGWFLGHIL